MAIVSQTPSVSEVKLALAETSNSVGGLCTSPKINKWSKWKPVKHPSKGNLTEQELKSVVFGLSLDRYGFASYDMPNGGDLSPYRLGDFRDYNKDARPPVSVEIISVNNNPTPPYQIVKDYSNTIEFKLIPGEIEPQFLRANCYRVKNTNPSGGFGGISWIAETTASTSTLVTRPTEEVFGTETLNVVFTQNVICNNVPRLEYMRYKGDAFGTYENTLNWIEDQGYLDSFVLVDYEEKINFVDAPTLFYNPIENMVDCRYRILNDSGSTANGFRITARYTINAPTMPNPGDYENLYFESAMFDLTIGVNSGFIPLQIYKQGEINTYTVYLYLEKLTGSTWSEVSSIQTFNKNVFIPAPI